MLDRFVSVWTLWCFFSSPLNLFEPRLIASARPSSSEPVSFGLVRLGLSEPLNLDRQEPREHRRPHLTEASDIQLTALCSLASCFSWRITMTGAEVFNLSAGFKPRGAAELISDLSSSHIKHLIHFRKLSYPRNQQTFSLSVRT